MTIQFSISYKKYNSKQEDCSINYGRAVFLLKIRYKFDIIYK